MPNPIVHFGLPADDVVRAKKFYEQAFGWKIICNSIFIPASLP